MAYQRSGARLAQGDIVRATVGVFGLAADLADRAALRRPSARLDAEQGVTLALPTAAGRTPYVLRAWETLALVLSADCVIPKASFVLVAPIRPLADAVPTAAPAIRAGEFVAAFYLPSEQTPPWASRKPFPEAVVDLNRFTAVTPSLTMKRRLMTLDDDQLDRLHATLVRFLVTRELSARGNLDAAFNKTVTRVWTVASSSRRHTVMLRFDDGSEIVVYQEPRQDAYTLESVTVRGGVFTRPSVQARVGQRLILRFENEDRQSCTVEGKALPKSPVRLAPADTTPVEILCPDQPQTLVLRKVGRPASTLDIRIVDVAEVT